MESVLQSQVRRGQHIYTLSRDVIRENFIKVNGANIYDMETLEWARDQWA